VARKVADVPWAAFASRAYIERRGAPKSFAEIDRHDVVQFDGPIAGHPGARWLKRVAPHARIAARCTSTPALVLAVKARESRRSP